MKKIVVTGATSMIGIAVVEACLKHDVELIYAVVRPNSANLSRIPKDDRIRVIECDMDQYATLEKLIDEKCDTFYHIAWSVTGRKRNSDIYGQVKNIQFTLDALHAASAIGCTKFIGAGSQAEYGKLDVEKIGIYSPVNPVQPYGIAKYAAGKLVVEEAKLFGISCIWVRIFSIYGKYDKPSTMISSSIKKMKAGEHVSFTAGEQMWDYLYSEDAGEAFYLIGEKVDENKVYCLGSGQAKKLRWFIEIMRDVVNPTLTLGLGEIPYTEETVMNLCADISELQTDTGWCPKTPFEDGIRMLKKAYSEY